MTDSRDVRPARLAKGRRVCRDAATTPHHIKDLRLRGVLLTVRRRPHAPSSTTAAGGFAASRQRTTEYYPIFGKSNFFCLENKLLKKILNDLFELHL